MKRKTVYTTEDLNKKQCLQDLRIWAQLIHNMTDLVGPNAKRVCDIDRRLNEIADELETILI